MRYITPSSLAIAVASLLASSCHGFGVLLPSTNAGRTNNVVRLYMSGEPHFDVEAASNTEEVQCYLIENDDDEQDDESSGALADDKSTIVCTSEPEEYAWYNGIDEKKMIPTDGTESGATECIEGASPRGTPEWECA
mmetsp:Transcript_4292/g.12108  ORF Transcript_4292/g.12108 Transcript_4292/m.12108 type:complete len:137 (-) Transcript_4292:185-595(-)